MQIKLDRDQALIQLDRQLMHPSQPEALWDFVQAAWSIVDPMSLVPERYMRELCRVLQETYRRVDERNLLVNLPPGMSKSLLAGVMLPAWSWTHDPKHRWGFASYDLGLVLRDARKCRQLIESPWYQARWPLAMRRDSNAQGEYTNEHNGYRISVTIRGGITGRHVDTFVIDDPQKPLGLAHDPSAAAVEATIARAWYDQTLPSRFSDHSNARKICIMQRISENDLAGHILDSPEAYRHVLWPMHYDPARACADDWRTVAGELLAPKRLGPAALARLEAGMRGDARTIAAQLEQNPTPPAGTFFHHDKIQFVDAVPDGLTTAVSIDCAVKDQGDYYAMQHWGRQGEHRYLLDAAKFRAPFDAAIPVMRDYLATCAIRDGKGHHRPSVCLIEDKANGPAAMAVLRSMDTAGYKLTAYDPGRAAKTDRAHAVLPLMQNVRVVQGAGTAAAVAEWVGFPGAKHDDQVDAMTQLLLHWHDASAGAAAWIKAMEAQR